ncbi:helix-turn-helix domain-containing protein [Kiloniella laminariae]|uniref:Helix-turn-helix domain-containing protein n=1 Tax=Kiloniella laminariae TaxID=454162 RepID=A0ABT4LEV5_9PROT|nr:helix-turn-helix domain-containing protein [Kiloniella laminariae]MCZ4279638.1 helix-turn-helix domain-containing protein [Kiloniella laminariae]
MAGRRKADGGRADTASVERLKQLQDSLRESVAQMEQWGTWAQNLLESRDGEIAALQARVDALEQRLLRESSDEPRLTNAEKREAITAYLKDPERRNWSDREIARQVGTSPQTVANWRQRLSLTSRKGQDRTVIRGGKVFKMRTDNIGQGKGE